DAVAGALTDAGPGLELSGPEPATTHRPLQDVDLARGQVDLGALCSVPPAHRLIPCAGLVVAVRVAQVASGRRLDDHLRHGRGTGLGPGGGTVVQDERRSVVQGALCDLLLASVQFPIEATL